MREHFYLHAYLIWQAVIGKYNFEKNASDNYDRWLLVYPAAGYIVVTADARLISNIRSVGCPEPVRVISIEEMTADAKIRGLL